MTDRNLSPEFWPEECRRDGDCATRYEMDAAWREWVGGYREMRTSALQGALGHCCHSIGKSDWPWARVADAMLQRARRAGVIRHMKGVRGAWEFTEAYQEGRADD